MLQFLFFCLTFALAKDENALNLIIDIGNTMAKVALFNGGEMVEVLTESNQSLDCLKALYSKYPVCLLYTSLRFLSLHLPKRKNKVLE